MAAGAGMIRLGSPGSPDAAWPTEAVRMHLPAEGWAGAFLEATAKCKAVVLGPGLGTGEATAEEIRAVIAAVPVPLVIDADALHRAGRTPPPRRVVIDKRSAPSILTPHDGEYARINGAGPGGRPPGVGPGAGPGHRGRRPAEGPAHRGGAARGDGHAPTSCWPRPADRRWPRRAAVTCSRASSAPSVPAGCPALERRPSPPTCTGAPHRSARPQGLVAGDLPGLVAELLSELADEGD